MSTNDFECPNCSKKYKKQGNLMRHMNMSFDCSVGQLWQCQHCQRYFNCKRNLDNHIRQRHAIQWAQKLTVRLITDRGQDHYLGLAPERGEIFPDAEALTQCSEYQQINNLQSHINEEDKVIVVIIDRKQQVSSNEYALRTDDEENVSQLSERSQQEIQLDVKQRGERLQDLHDGVSRMSVTAKQNEVTVTQHSERASDNEVAATQQSERAHDNEVVAAAQNNKRARGESVFNQTFLVKNEVSENLESYIEISSATANEDTQVTETQYCEGVENYQVFPQSIKNEIIGTEVNEMEIPPPTVREENWRCETQLSERVVNYEFNPQPIRNELFSDFPQTQITAPNQGYESDRILITRSIVNEETRELSQESETQLSIKRFKSELPESKVFTYSELWDENGLAKIDEDMYKVFIQSSGQAEKSNESISASQQSTIFDSLSQNNIDDFIVLDSDLNIFKTVLLRNPQKDVINVAVFLKRLTKSLYDIIEDSLKQHDKLKLNFELSLEIALIGDDNDIYSIQTQAFQTSFKKFHQGDDINVFIDAFNVLMLLKLNEELAENCAVLEIKQLEVNVGQCLGADCAPLISVNQNF